MAAASVDTADTTDASGPDVARAGIPVQLLEHQCCLPAPDADSRQLLPAMEGKRRKYLIEQSFSTYNMIVRFLSHKVLPMQSWKTRLALRRMATRFSLIDGVLMYTRVSPPVRVSRCREEVNAILEQFHDNQGHPSYLSCQREITKGVLLEQHDPGRGLPGLQLPRLPRPEHREEVAPLQHRRLQEQLQAGGARPGPHLPQVPVHLR